MRGGLRAAGRSAAGARLRHRRRASSRSIAAISRRRSARSAGIPRWAVAFKFPPTTATTRLLDIGINVGRTGALNPSPCSSPSRSAGSSCSSRRCTTRTTSGARTSASATRDRAARRRRDPAGRRAGARAARPAASASSTCPTTCPACGTPVVRPEGEAAHRCPNPICPSRGLEAHQALRLARRARHRRRRRAAVWPASGSSGSSGALADLYRLTVDQLLELDGFQQRSAEKRRSPRSTRSRQRPFGGSCSASAFRHVGAVTAEAIAQHFRSLAAADASRRRRDRRGRGRRADRRRGAGGVVRRFPSNAELLDDLAAAGLTLELTGDAPPPGEGPFAGLTFVITGTLARPRATKPRHSSWSAEAR